MARNLPAVLTDAFPAMVLMMRATGDPESLAPAVRWRIAALDRNLPIENLRAFEKTLGATLERRRFSTLLLTSFAALAIAALAVLFIILLSALLPVWRATQVDALQKLHHG